MFGTFSQADFIKWNPSVGGDCSNGVVVGTNYCVAIPGTPTTRASTVTQPTPPTSDHSPTQDGITADCTRFWLVSSVDTCATIASRAGVSQALLTTWNPALGDSCSGLQRDFYVCIGGPGDTSTDDGTGTTSASATTRSGTTTTKETTSTGATTASGGGGAGTPTPTPIQSGMSSGCNKFYLVKGGDGCWAIANSNSIALSDFYTWNPAVNNGGECAGLWPDYYVCIGK